VQRGARRGHGRHRRAALAGARRQDGQRQRHQRREHTADRADEGRHGRGDGQGQRTEHAQQVAHRPPVEARRAAGDDVGHRAGQVVDHAVAGR
jgi:hypothetical protein